MTDPSHYTGFPRYTGPEQGQTVYPPKDTSWMADASCVGMDAELFFSESGASTPAGRAVCASGVVRQECLEYALTPPLERWGLWGSLTSRERSKLRGRRVV